jgi:hypothetical protein
MDGDPFMEVLISGQIIKGLSLEQRNPESGVFSKAHGEFHDQGDAKWIVINQVVMGS